MWNEAFFLSLRKIKLKQIIQQKYDVFWVPYKGQIIKKVYFFFCRWGTEWSITNSVPSSLLWAAPCAYLVLYQCQKLPFCVEHWSLRFWWPALPSDLAAFRWHFLWESLCAWFSKKVFFFFIGDELLRRHTKTQGFCGVFSAF